MYGIGQTSQLPVSTLASAPSMLLPMCVQKDYWCHVSDTIALDDQGSDPLADNQLQTHDHSYTRPLICKVNQNVCSSTYNLNRDPRTFVLVIAHMEQCIW